MFFIISNLSGGAAALSAQNRLLAGCHGYIAVHKRIKTYFAMQNPPAFATRPFNGFAIARAYRLLRARCLTRED
ncbi:MAG: hypothetical protein ACJ8F3_05935 [Xanthobacteraceae bacterium]